MFARMCPLGIIVEVRLRYGTVRQNVSVTDFSDLEKTSQ